CAANKKIEFVPLRSTGRACGAPHILALAAVFLPELHTCELFCIGSFFVQFYRKVQKSSVTFFLQAGVRVLSFIPPFMPASKSSFAVCISQAGRR
ncbi:hypothetical protein, partial [Endozoicomonas ascidiicola]|uniref:hypothetical protein n=1 Tax=Endozoicomonas ascidiicola TaxID=1698521 RepID=UPI000ADF518F